MDDFQEKRVRKTIKKKTKETWKHNGSKGKNLWTDDLAEFQLKRRRKVTKPKQRKILQFLVRDLPRPTGSEAKALGVAQSAPAEEESTTSAPRETADCSENQPVSGGTEQVALSPTPVDSDNGDAAVKATEDIICNPTKSPGDNLTGTLVLDSGSGDASVQAAIDDNITCNSTESPVEPPSETLVLSSELVDSGIGASSVEKVDNKANASTTEGDETPKRRGLRTNRNTRFPDTLHAKNLPSSSTSQTGWDDQTTQAFLIQARLNEQSESESDLSEFSKERKRTNKILAAFESSGSDDNFSPDADELDSSEDEECQSSNDDQADVRRSKTSAKSLAPVTKPAQAPPRKSIISSTSCPEITEDAHGKAKRCQRKKLHPKAAAGPVKKGSKNVETPDNTVEDLDQVDDVEMVELAGDGQGAGRPRTKRPSREPAGPANKKARTTLSKSVAWLGEDGQEVSETRSKKTDKDRRTLKPCRFCPHVTRQHLHLHIYRKHSEHAPTLEKAKQLAASVTKSVQARKKSAPVGTITLTELTEWYGETWEMPGVKDKTLELMGHLNVHVAEDLQPPQPEVSDEVRQEEEEFLPEETEREPGSVKFLKKKYRLYDQVPDDFPVVANYKHTRVVELRKDKRACDNSCNRLKMIFAYAKKKEPEKSPWELLLQHEACWEYFTLSRVKCGVAPPTLLSFAKDMVCVCEYARERWLSKLTDIPNDEAFREQLQSVLVFWKDKERALQEETDAARNQKLSTGTAKVADLNRLYAYIEDETVLKEVNDALERLEALQRVTGRVKITKTAEDSANILAWNLVVKFLMVSALIQNASRTGVVENMTVQEFQAANKLRGKWIVQVAKHKRAKDGAAKIRIHEMDYQRWSRFVDLRQKMPVKKPNEKLLFVTIGGMPMRHVTSVLNRWNREKGYEEVTVNMIRRATQDAAAAQGMDVQTDVSRHMAHSLATAERNYRSKNLDASVRAGDAVQLVQENYRCFKMVTENPTAYFANDEEFPSHEELQRRFRQFLNRRSFKLTPKTYSDLQDVYEAECLQ